MIPEYHAGGVVIAEAKLRQKKPAIPRFICFRCGKLFYTGKEFWKVKSNGCPVCGCIHVVFNYKEK